MIMTDHLAAAADLVRDLETKLEATRFALAERDKELDTAFAEIDRIRSGVREIHAPLDAVHERHGEMQVCAECCTDAGNWVRWPCRTITVLDAVAEAKISEPVTVSSEAISERDDLGWIAARYKGEADRLRATVQRVRELAQADLKCPCCSGYEDILSTLAGDDDGGQECLCDGGSYQVVEHPFIVHPDCPIHGGDHR